MSCRYEYLGVCLCLSNLIFCAYCFVCCGRVNVCTLLRHDILVAVVIGVGVMAVVFSYADVPFLALGWGGAGRGGMG